MPDEMISIRGLVEGGKGPLKEFKGKLVGYTSEVNSRSKKTVFLINFSDLEVIESTEPYNFPVFQIRINASNRANSAWGIYAKSLQRVLDSGVDKNTPDNQRKDIKDTVGKLYHIKLTPGHDFGESDEIDPETKKKKRIIQECWEVVEVEGFGSGAASSGSRQSPGEVAEALLDGKTVQQFSTEAFQNEAIRSDPDLQRAIADRSFITALVSTNKFIQDAATGIYKKVVA